MGNFSINIQGIGVYDSYEFRQRVYDFINGLQQNQCQVLSATCTFGGQQDFLAGTTHREIAIEQKCCSCEIPQETQEPEAS